MVDKPRNIVKGSMKRNYQDRGAMTVVALRVAAPGALFVAALGFNAHADIFSWVDEAGTVNFTNEAPPEGVRARTVARENPAPPVLNSERRESQDQAEIRALSERVHRLEADAALAASGSGAPPPQFVPPMPLQSYAAPSPPPEQVSYAFSVPGVEPACSPSWRCDYGRSTLFYPTYVYVLPPLRGHGFHRSHELRDLRGGSLFGRPGAGRSASPRHQK